MYFTNKDITANIFGKQATLPKGSRVLLVHHLDGLKGAGFAAGNIKQLIELSGNAHDPKYRYFVIAAADVDADNKGDQREVERIRAKQSRA